MRQWIGIGWLAFGLSACAGLRLPDSAPMEPEEGASAENAVYTTGESKLYARDGSIIGVNDRSSSATQGPQRELAPSEGGRMYILELYQKAIDERDALSGELRALQADLELAKSDNVKRDAALAERSARIEQLTAENKRLLDENIELAARLTTAQIRRLQVEKILLETRIAELSSAAMEAAPPLEAPPTTESKP